jgi:hypothetical protein
VPRSQGLRRSNRTGAHAGGPGIPRNLQRLPNCRVPSRVGTALTRLMTKQLTPDAIALTPRERVLLFCAGSRIDWKRAGIMSETVTSL